MRLVEGHRARVKPLANDQVDIIIASKCLELLDVVWIVLPVTVHGQNAVTVLHELQAALDARVQRNPLAEIGVAGQHFDVSACVVRVRGELEDGHTGNWVSFWVRRRCHRGRNWRRVMGHWK